MIIAVTRLFSIALIGTFLGCGDRLPAHLEDYASADNCFQMNPQPIAPTADDPHEGEKNVYVCNVLPEALIDPAGAPIFPYPEGTLIIKESRKEHQSYPWLIATAEKLDGVWKWTEYTRNFANEEFVKISVSESVCTDCHNKAKGTDFIYTIYTP
jgi:hypothetical protein